MIRSIMEIECDLYFPLEIGQSKIERETPDIYCYNSKVIFGRLITNDILAYIKKLIFGSLIFRMEIVE